MLIRKPHNRTEWLLLLAVLSFIPTLFFYLVGEEGIYTITSMEMAHQKNWLQQTMYGADNGRPPLINWLIVPIAHVIGWGQVVIAARLVSVAATLGLVGWVYLLCRRLTSDRAFAVFAALTCLSLADLLLYRGWLTYTDPLFAFFTFGAIASLWIGAQEKRPLWVLLSVVLVSGALLTKALTAHIFYATALLVLLTRPEPRRALLSPRVLLVFPLALIIPFFWFANQPASHHGSGMLNEILLKLSAQGIGAYLQRLVIYPLNAALELSPPLILALYLKLRQHPQQEAAPAFKTAFWIALLAFLPYWLAPQGGIRYLLPIYPMIALVCANRIWRSGATARTLALRWFTAIIAIKFLFALILFPVYQIHYRGKNYAQAAQTILQHTQGQPLYVTDVRAPTLSIVSYIDASRFPAPPITFPPKPFHSGYVLSMTENPEHGTVAQTYRLASDTLYLLCKGSACPRPSDNPSGP